MEEIECGERCAQCHKICGTPQILPCGDIVCNEHCPPIVRGQPCPVCKKIFISERLFQVPCPTNQEDSSRLMDDSTGELRDNWFGMGTKRGRERYLTSPCENWFFCGHEACYLSHQKSMGLKRGRQVLARTIED